jgi:menaquinone-dependent protoporphyrinogen oxidase
MVKATVGGDVMRALVAVATQHGATLEIADMIGATIAARGIETDIREVENVPAVDGYDGVVVGSAVYMGNWIKSARTFVEGHADELAARPTWMFSSGPIGDPPKPDAATAVNVDDLVAAAHAREHRLFAGRLDLNRLGLVQRAIARTVRSPEGDYRDWGEIQAWATSIADDLEAQAPEGQPGVSVG